MLILSSGLADEMSVSPLQSMAAFRKASKKMMLSYAAVASAINSIGLSKDVLKESGLVLNTGFGEIEATGGFLKAFAELGVARPLLFQNSLHNSTTGFLAIQFGIHGPVLTVNHRTQGGDEALEIASTMLEEKICQVCFVVTAETVPPEFAGQSGIGCEGAAALVLSTDSFCAQYSLRALADQNVISEELSRVSKVDLPLKGLRSLLEFDSVFRLAQRLNSGSRA